MKKYMSTSSNSSTYNKLLSCSCLDTYQQWQSIHVDEEQELQLLTNISVIPDIFLPQLLTNNSIGVAEQSTQLFNVSCYSNESQTCQRTNTASQFPGNSLGPSSPTFRLVLEDNVSLPYNYPWKNSIGVHEPIQNMKHCCTSNSKLVSNL